VILYQILCLFWKSDAKANHETRITALENAGGGGATFICNSSAMDSNNPKHIGFWATSIYQYMSQYSRLFIKLDNVPCANTSFYITSYTYKGCCMEGIDSPGNAYIKMINTIEHGGGTDGLYGYIDVYPRMCGNSLNTNYSMLLHGAVECGISSKTFTSINTVIAGRNNQSNNNVFFGQYCKSEAYSTMKLYGI